MKNINLVKKMIKTQLNENFAQVYVIYKTYNGSHEREIAVYYDLNLAKKICSILQKNSSQEDFKEEILYTVKSHKQISPAKPNLVKKYG